MQTTQTDQTAEIAYKPHKPVCQKQAGLCANLRQFGVLNSEAIHLAQEQRVPLKPQVFGDHFFDSGLDGTVLISAWPFAIQFLRSLRIVGRKRRLGFNDLCAANRFFAVPSTPDEDPVNFRENRWHEAQEILS